MIRKSIYLVILASTIILIESSCVAPRGQNSTDRLMQIDSTKLSEFVEKAIRGPGPVNPTGIPPQDKFVVAVGIKDGPCNANGGDIVYLAYKMVTGDNFWDCILRFKNGRITQILKVNNENSVPPKEMIRRLLETHCK